MASTMIRVAAALLGICVAVLAWNGNLGKAAACIVAPWSLEVNLYGNQLDTSSTAGVS